MLGRSFNLLGNSPVRTLILLLTFVGNSAFAQTLTLEDCIRLAQSAPSNLTSAKIQTDIARYGLTQARANFLPQFAAAGSYTYNSPPPGGGDSFSFVALNGV